MITLEAPAVSKAKTLRIRTPEKRLEVGWFGALCGEDYEYLGVPEPRFASTFEHCSEIFRRTAENGYQSILMPSAFNFGQETLVFGGAMAVANPSLQQLTAIRMGEIHPPMLARHVATLDHMLKGRLTVNIISSELPGEKISPSDRYLRSEESLQILEQCWTRDSVDFDGTFYKIKLPSTAATRTYQEGGPLRYFGGISEEAREICAKYCDVFLTWPETREQMAETMQDISDRAWKHGRVIDYGLRIHVIVRETEQEARDYARHIMSKVDSGLEEKIRQSRDFQYTGTRRQDELRATTKDDYIEKNVWSGIGRVRAGCGSAIVGDPDQVYSKIQQYLDMGMRALILSGYPHLTECDLFAKYVLPRLKTFRLPDVHKRPRIS
jgi:alkanesulfonate monooxygenase